LADDNVFHFRGGALEFHGRQWDARRAFGKAVVSLHFSVV